MTGPPVQVQARGGTPSAQVNPAAMPPWWGVLPKWVRGKEKRPYTYTADFLPLPASTTRTVNVNITSDAHFVVLQGKMVVTSSDNLTLLSFPPALCLLTLTSTGRQLESSAVHVLSMFGTGAEPAYWAYPLLVEAGSTLTVQLQNLEAVDRNYRLSFDGFKVFSNDES